MFKLLQHCTLYFLWKWKCPWNEGGSYQLDGSTCGLITTEASCGIQRCPGGQVDKNGWEEEKVLKNNEKGKTSKEPCWKM